MKITSYFFNILITSLIISMTLHSIYTGFGPEAKKLRDPFQEHED
uniref:Protein PsbN n=1 Tax=Trachelomonas grandis TaxID=215769 RepID=A0A385ULQ6_9EUGL|nr:photosystem II N protein [Trachelomonas grandis]